MTYISSLVPCLIIQPYLFSHLYASNPGFQTILIYQVWHAAFPFQVFIYFLPFV